MRQLQFKMSSPIGSLFIIATELGLSNVGWRKTDVPMIEDLNLKGKSVHNLAKTVMQLDEYFKCQRKTFDIEFDIEGSGFQIRVWEQLKKIPFGSTVAYRDIARKLSQPKAMRAVGTANGRNPISIIIPCHRVIAADGTLGGYAGGLEIKRQLLRLEGLTQF